MESLPSIAILKKFEFLCPFSRPLSKLKKKIMFCFRTELNTKSLFTTTSNVLPFKFKCWQQKFCRVKLIPWNLVNLSHIYSFYLTKVTWRCEVSFANSTVLLTWSTVHFPWRPNYFRWAVFASFSTPGFWLLFESLPQPLCPQYID